MLGNVNLDVVLGPLAAWPSMGTETFLAASEVRAGGAAANTALALRALRTPVRVHATIGHDAFGDVLAAEVGDLSEHLVSVPSSTAYSVGITHPGGERTFLTHLGHLASFDVDAAARLVCEAPPSFVLVCGYFLLPPLRTAATADLLRRARARGHTTLLDTGWPSEGFTEEVTAELAALLPHLDVILPNEIEATAWTGQTTVDQAIDAFARLGARAVVKRGASGASWRDREGIRHSAAPSVDVADTVGAGDCFNAALLSALHRGHTLARAVDAAVAYASRVVSLRPRTYPTTLEDSSR